MIDVDGGSQPAAGLGALLGAGRTAEVFAWGDGEVLKLLRTGFPERLGEREAAVAVMVAGMPVAAPRFGGTTRVDGRLGLVYELLRGPSMLDGVAARPWEIDRGARRFAELHAAMHRADGTGLPDQREDLRHMIDRARDSLPAGARDAALARLDALPAAWAVCHGDMHPGNVIVTPRAEVVIDWETATCGNPAGDVARTLFLLRHGSAPDHLPRLRLGLIEIAKRHFASTYLRRYRRLRRVDDRELAAWRLPVLAARLGEGIADEREALIALIKREAGLDRGAG